MLLRPPVLQKGDTVLFVSTARKISEVEIEPARKLMESWGLKVKLGLTIGLEDRQFAGTDAARLADFQSGLDNENVRAIICSRGGYGTVRMMDQLDWTKFMLQPKWICGFSDVTYLHVHLNQTLGIQTLHAPMPATFERTTTAALESMRLALFEGKTELHSPVHALNRIGVATGTLIGGNLSILYSITGTKSGFNTENKILVLEDLDEYLYHLDRMMLNLKRSGKLERLAGLMVGGLSDMRDNAVPFGRTAEEIVLEAVAEYNYPVVFGMPFGHIADNHALILGRKMTLQVGATGGALV
ncbi:MAG: LD-carboxypeptidase [Chitinophagales bacterium]